MAPLRRARYSMHRKSLRPTACLLRHAWRVALVTASVVALASAWRLAAPAFGSTPLPSFAARRHARHARQAQQVRALPTELDVLGGGGAAGSPYVPDGIDIEKAAGVLEKTRRVRRLLARAPVEGGGDPGEVDPSMQWFNEHAVEVVIVALLMGLFIWARSLMDAVNAPNDIVPRGDMPTLSEWLRENAPRRGRSSQQGQQIVAPRDGVMEVSLEPVCSAGELWEAYTFATAQIVKEVPSMLLDRDYLATLILQLAAFPKVYQEWERYESCIIDELFLGPEATALEPINESGVARAPLPEGGSRDVVLECGKMLDSYGLSLIARGKAGLAGAATLIVKRLPEECHIEEDGEEVVCTVQWDAVIDAPALEAVAYLETIAVAGEWRGSGLAGRLLDFAEKKSSAWGLRLMALHVHRDNWAALRFYEARGFEVTSDWMGWGPLFFLLLKPLPPLPPKATATDVA